MTDVDVLAYPLVTEKAMNDLDFENKLAFVVHIDATKGEIAEAISSRFDVVVAGVNTQITPQGRKKAIIELGPDDDAEEVISRIGVF